MSRYRFANFGLKAGLSLIVAWTLPASVTQAQGVAPKTGSAGDKPTSSAVIQLKRAVNGEFQYRFLTGKGESTPLAPLPAPTGTDGLIALTLPSGVTPDAGRLEVMDTARGTLARLSVPKRNEPISLNEGVFRFAQVVVVPVQSKGKAVYGPLVSLTGKSFQQERLLTKSDNGVARFENVPIGEELTTTVRYAANPAVRSNRTLLTDSKADGFRWPVLEVDWAEVPTLALAATPNATPGPTQSAPVVSPAAAQPNPNPLNSLLNMVLSVALLAGIGYGIYWAVQKGHAKQLMDRLGIQTAPPTAEVETVASPFVKPKPPPIQPITEGTADPLAGGTALSPSDIAVARSAPRLVATAGTYAGNIYPLNGGALDIGRESSMGVALANDTNASRRHATIQNANGQYTVTDHNSSNGTFLNGARVMGTQPLRPGDELVIGATRFRFEA